MDIYDTRALIATVYNLLPSPSFLTRTFFPNARYADTQAVAIDIFTGKRRIAPFVHPLREGRYVESIGFQTVEFTPPTVKDKRRLDPTRAVRRSIGERIGGSFSPIEREMANLAFELEDQMGMLARRIEVMAGSALSSSSVTIVGDGYPTSVVAFGRDPALTVTLTGASRWGQTGIYPTMDLDTWAAKVQRTSGRTVTDVVFTQGAWQPFRADPRVAQIIGSLVNGNANFQAAGVRANTGGTPLGTWGPYRLWLYNDWYIDPADNTEKPILADGTVLLGSAEIDGTVAYGVILDADIGFPVQGAAPKSWVEKDPGVRWLMLQSAPIVIPTNVNASFSAQVI